MTDRKQNNARYGNFLSNNHPATFDTIIFRSKVKRRKNLLAHVMYEATALVVIWQSTLTLLSRGLCLHGNEKREERHRSIAKFTARYSIVYSHLQEPTKLVFIRSI